LDIIFPPEKLFILAKSMATFLDASFYDLPLPGAYHIELGLRHLAFYDESQRRFVAIRE
jgi:hypothetical protein